MVHDERDPAVESFSSTVMSDSISAASFPWSALFHLSQDAQIWSGLTPFPQKVNGKPLEKLQQLCVDRGLSQHFMVEHKMYCTLAAVLSKDWSKMMELSTRTSKSTLPQNLRSSIGAALHRSRWASCSESVSEPTGVRT
jgi:hypothetical protein